MEKIVKNICDKLSKKQINWDDLETYVSGLGEKINVYDEDQDESILSEVYQSHGRAGNINLRLTEIFLKHGFDVKANAGKNGESCLCALCWSSYDHYILHVAEKLFDAGARDRDGYEKDKDDDEYGVLNSIGWKFGYWHTGSYDAANMFVAYYIMAQRALSGEKYSGIRAFRDCVGKTVSKVERIKEKGVRGEKIRTSYLFHCEDMHLVASDCVEFIVSPYARDEALEIEDVSDEYHDLIGAKVHGLRYFNSTLARIKFDNGFALLVGDTCSEANKEGGAWFSLTTDKYNQLPAEGTAIESIKLWAEIKHSEDSTYYREHTVVLCTREYAFALYANGNGYEDASIRVEKMKRELVEDIERRIDVDHIVLKHVERSSEAVKWISLRCDEGFIYIVSEGYADVAIFMSEQEIEPSEVGRVGSYTPGLKKIKPLS